MQKSQKAFIEVEGNLFEFEIPNENEEIMPDVKWGNVAGFPTIAYWYYRVFESRLKNTSIKYRLGNTLLEKVGACLLGGHGIPAENGLTAFYHMKNKGAFNGEIYSVEQLYEWLSQPIQNQDKTFKYRFAKQKSKYLHSAIEKITTETAPCDTGLSLRDWLTDIKGIGLKTASWVARNWLDADDVAILDIHIYRAGILGGFFDEAMTIEKHYHCLEKKFINLANSMNVRPSELDALIWYEMQKSNSVKNLIENKYNSSLSSSASTNHSSANPYQLAFI